MFAWIGRHKVAILTTLGVLPAFAVAVVTGNASWGHIVHVGVTVGEPSAAWLPVAVDGMMLTGALFAWVDTVRGYKPRGWSYVTLILGSAMTLTFNVVSAISRGPAAMVVAAIYAITFLATVETILHPSKRLRAAMDKERASNAASEPTSEPAVVEAVPATPVEPVKVVMADVTSAPVMADKPFGPMPHVARRPRKTPSRGMSYPGPSGTNGSALESAVVDVAVPGRERPVLAPTFEEPESVTVE